MRAAALVALVALARADLLQGPGDMHVSGDLTVAGALEARSPACAEVVGHDGGGAVGGVARARRSRAPQPRRPLCATSFRERAAEALP